MFIVPLSSMQPITSMQAQASSDGAAPASGGFSGIFQEALANARETQAVADADAIKVALGQADNMAQVMINSAKASTATQLTVDIASRVVSSYKEIMQMQV